MSDAKTTVSLRLCNDYDRELVGKAVLSSIDDLGGIDKFVRKDQLVLIKPNFLVAREASQMVTTHPEVVRAVMGVVADMGARMVVGDSPAMGSAKTVAKKAGIMEVAEHFGVEVINFIEPCRAEKKETCTYQILELSREALDADVIINVAKVKTHGAMTVTLGVKNMFGCVVGKAKTQWHFKAGRDAAAFARMLVDIYATLAPALTVADGIVGMEGNGPSSGDKRRLGWIAASPDAVALDRIITEILRVPLDRMYTLQAAKQAGVGETDIERIEVLGDSIEAACAAGQIDRRPLELPADVPLERSRLGELMRRVLKRRFTPEPVIDNKICTRCGTCIEVCPSQAMSFERMRKKKGDYDKKVVIDRMACIHCFCCQELCPEGAITIKSGSLAGFLARSPA